MSSLVAQHLQGLWLVPNDPHSMNTPQVPIAIEQPMPHRKIIREWLIPLADRNTALALVLLVADLSIWGALMVMAGVILVNLAPQTQRMNGA
jgi:omega-6 fatty acid desaturase (delta-12 desaturase)